MGSLGLLLSKQREEHPSEFLLCSPTRLSRQWVLEPDQRLTLTDQLVIQASPQVLYLLYRLVSDSQPVLSTFIYHVYGALDNAQHLNSSHILQVSNAVHDWCKYSHG